MGFFAFVHGFALIVLLIAIISSNIFCIVVLRRVRTIINNAPLMLMTSLSVADLLNGFGGVLPQTLTFLSGDSWSFNHIYTPGICKAQALLLKTCQIIKVMLLLALNLDRYVAVTKALQYHNIVTTKLVYIGTAAIWALSVVAAVICAIGSDWVVTSGHVNVCFFKIDIENLLVWLDLIFLVVFPFLVTILIYFRLSVIARHHAAQIDMLPGPNYNINQQGLVHRKQAEKAAKTFRVMTIVFALSWLPALLTGLLASKLHGNAAWLLKLFVFVTFCSGFCNIIVYFLRNGIIRAACRSMLKKKQSQCQLCLLDCLARARVCCSRICPRMTNTIAESDTRSANISHQDSNSRQASHNSRSSAIEAEAEAENLKLAQEKSKSSENHESLGPVENLPCTVYESVFTHVTSAYM